MNIKVCNYSFFYDKMVVYNKTMLDFSLAQNIFLGLSTKADGS